MAAEVTSRPDSIPEWPCALGGVAGSAILKGVPQDFKVDELMAIEPNGSGEFLWLRVEKTDHNTAWVAERLAQWAGVTRRDVSSAGLKDRRAVARQWFSVHLPGKPDPDLDAFDEPGIRVLNAVRHARKLRTGAHSGNRFEIVLRAFDGDAQELTARCEALAGGVPNYFGPQRFGRGGDNLRQARALYAGTRRPRGRHMTGLLHSAARAYLFNQVLGRRVSEGNWRDGLDGDIWMLAGTHSVFGPEPLDESLTRRCAEGDIAPTGPLVGRGPQPSDSAAGRLESEVLAQHPELVNGLTTHGLRAARRPLVARPQNLSWSIDVGALTLTFDLPPGQYATAVLREVVDYLAPQYWGQSKGTE